VNRREANQLPWLLSEAGTFYKPRASGAGLGQQGRPRNVDQVFDNASIGDHLARTIDDADVRLPDGQAPRPMAQPIKGHSAEQHAGDLPVAVERWNRHGDKRGGRQTAEKPLAHVGRVVFENMEDVVAVAQIDRCV